MIKKTISILALIFTLYSCSNNRDEILHNGPEYIVKTFRVDRGWAYSIFINDKEYVRQLYIPAIEGKVPFASDSQAEKTGWYVVSKLKNNASPSLSKKELVTLNILPSGENHATIK
jgi:uncharacterized lipoprotein NlpE involved in copper resistance